jgi:hypothetical protein
MQGSLAGVHLQVVVKAHVPWYATTTLPVSRCVKFELKPPPGIKMQKGRDVNFKFIPSVFFPTDARRFLGNFQLPGEKELLGKL